jgi:hypothetical protein
MEKEAHKGGSRKLNETQYLQTAVNKKFCI